MLLACIQKVIIPLITMTMAASFSEALALMNGISWLFLLLPVLFAMQVFNVIRERWSITSYVSSFVFLILGVLILCTGVVMLFVEPITGTSVSTVAVALVMAVTMWSNGRALKTYKA
ncbi:hypothetical protein BTA51_28525 [Hahella sp. CCB-MM4]|nr:hypothetical protein BTA51_28525 [Hahella sp. CCB-MM4]